MYNTDANVGRPSYYFFDPLFFAVDAPYGEGAGVDPGILSGNRSAPRLFSPLAKLGDWVVCPG